MSFTFHKFIRQHVYLGVLTPTTKIVNKSNKGCIFQVGTWWVYMGWSQCLRDLVTKLETPQFAPYFDILDFDIFGTTAQVDMAGLGSKRISK